MKRFLLLLSLASLNTHCGSANEPSNIQSQNRTDYMVREVTSQEVADHFKPNMGNIFEAENLIKVGCTDNTCKFVVRLPDAFSKEVATEDGLTRLNGKGAYTGQSATTALTDPETIEGFHKNVLALPAAKQEIVDKGHVLVLNPDTNMNIYIYEKKISINFIDIKDGEISGTDPFSAPNI